MEKMDFFFKWLVPLWIVILTSCGGGENASDHPSQDPPPAPLVTINDDIASAPKIIISDQNSTYQYKLYYSVNDDLSNSNSIVLEENQLASVISDKTIFADYTHYTLAFSAIWGSRESELSNSVSVKLRGEAPVFAEHTVYADYIQLNWNALEDEAKNYTLYWSTTEDFENSENITEINATVFNFDITSLKDYEYIYFKLSRTINGIESSVSPALSIAIDPEPPSVNPPPRYSLLINIANLTSEGLNIKIIADSSKENTYNLSTTDTYPLILGNDYSEGTYITAQVIKQPNNPPQYCEVSPSSLTIDRNSTISVSCISLPETPENLSLTPTTKSLLLSWDTVENADEYFVYLKANSSENIFSEEPNPVTSNNFVFSSAEKDITYYFTVIAKNIAGEGAGSEIISGLLIPTGYQVKVARPENLTSNGMVFNLNIKNKDAETGGNIELKVNSNSDFPLPFPGEFAEDSTYIASIKTQPSNPEQQCSINNPSGVLTDEITLTSSCKSLPGNPENLVARPGYTEIELSWVEVPSTTKYWIYIKEGSEPNFESDTPVESNTNQYVFTEAEKHKTYYFQVVAENEVGLGAASASVKSELVLREYYLKLTSFDSLQGDAFIFEINVTPYGSDISSKETITLIPGQTLPSPIGPFTDESNFEISPTTQPNNPLQSCAPITTTGAITSDIDISIICQSLPNAPQNIAVTADFSNITIDWDSVDGATKYWVYVKQGADPDLVNDTPYEKTNNQFVFTTAEKHTSYHIQVVAENIVGRSDASEIVTGQLQLQPFKLQITSIENLKSLGLSLEATVTPFGETTPIKKIISLSPADTLPTLFNSYSEDSSYSINILTQPSNPAQLCGINNSIGTVTSDTNISISCQSLPGTPQNVTSIASYTDITLSWDPVPIATEYLVYIKEGSAPDLINDPPFSTTNTQFVFTSVVKHKDYHFQVVAKNIVGIGEPNSPTNVDQLKLHLYAINVNSINNLQGTGLSLEATVTPYNGGTENFPLNIAPGEALPKSFGNFTEDSTYSITVSDQPSTPPQWCELDSNSDTLSNETNLNVNCISQPDPPQNLTATSTPTSITLTWDVVPNVTTYNVYGGTNGTIDYTAPLFIVTDATQVTDSRNTLAKRTKYNYAVKSVNKAGKSPTISNSVEIELQLEKFNIEITSVNNLRGNGIAVIENTHTDQFGDSAPVTAEQSIGNNPPYQFANITEGDGYSIRVKVDPLDPVAPDPTNPLQKCYFSENTTGVMPASNISLTINCLDKPDQPTNVQIDYSRTSVSLSWAQTLNPNNVDRYVIYRSLTGSIDTQGPYWEVVTNTSYTDVSTFDFSNIYTYAVVAERVVPGQGTYFQSATSLEVSTPDFRPEMVEITGGQFQMGDETVDRASPLGAADELPRHAVTINYDFKVSAYEISFEKYDLYLMSRSNNPINNPSVIALGNEAHDFGMGRGNKPVISVSYDDIKGYLSWLNGNLGLSGSNAYRLLTEAEWEYVARAGGTGTFGIGDGNCLITTSANFYDGSDMPLANKPAGVGNYENCDTINFYRDMTIEIDQFTANGWGLFNMHGNVREWVEDCHASNYTAAPVDGSAYMQPGCPEYVFRGGSYWDSLNGLRSAVRYKVPPNTRYRNLGFRIAKTLP